MATGSVALIYTNAMMGGYDDNKYNLRQLEVVLGAIGNELIFAHELHELTRRLCAKKDGDRVGRTNYH